jgi:ParB family chromosome partitioning protein
MSKKLSNERRIIAVEMSKVREPKLIARTQIDKDALQELADSIAVNGLIHPIKLKTVRGGFEIVAGHRRFLAHKMLNKKTIDAEIDTMVSKSAETMKLHENMFREDLSVIDEAYMYKELKTKNKLSDNQLAKMVNKSQSYVQQRLSILQYPDSLYSALVQKELSFSAARELVRITDEQVLNDYVYHAVTSGITPKVAKQWADDWLRSQAALKGEEIPEEQYQSNGAQQMPQFPCQFCGKLDLAENQMMLRVCRDQESCNKRLTEGEK